MARSAVLWRTVGLAVLLAAAHCSDDAAPRGAKVVPTCPTGILASVRQALNPWQVRLERPRPPRGWQGDVVVVFHGSGGPDRYTAQLLERVRSMDRWQRLTPRVVHLVDWSARSRNFLTAAFWSQRTGRAAADMLRDLGPLRNVHVVGISVGAFAADACAVALKAEGASPAPYVRVTFLDPFTLRGLLGFGYGRRHFGRAADFALQVLNTDDPVPSTNSPLPRCLCYDVTPAKEAFGLGPGYNGHDWPVDFLGRRYRNHAPRWPLQSDADAPRHGEGRPRGRVETISTTSTYVY